MAASANSNNVTPLAVCLITSHCIVLYWFFIIFEISHRAIHRLRRRHLAPMFDYFQFLFHLISYWLFFSCYFFIYFQHPVIMVLKKQVSFRFFLKFTFICKNSFFFYSEKSLHKFVTESRSHNRIIFDHFIIESYRIIGRRCVGSARWSTALRRTAWSRGNNSIHVVRSKAIW